MMPASYTTLLDSLLLDLRKQLLQAYDTCHQEGAVSAASSISQMQTTDVAHALSLASRLPQDTNFVVKTDISEGSEGASRGRLSPAMNAMDSMGSGMDHGDASQVMKSGLAGKSQAETQKVKHRLQLRLGALSASRLVTGKSLHDAVAVLGLTRYTVEDMNNFVNLLADFIHLEFRHDHSMDEDSEVTTSIEISEEGEEVTTADETEALGKAVWQWPDSSNLGASAAGSQPKITAAKTSTFDTNIVATRSHNVVPAQALVDVFLAQEGSVQKKIWGGQLPMYRAMKEILLASETNRLVAELTFVRINDLAAPVERMNALMYMEPLVAILIVANGMMIGFQTDPNYEDWTGWIYFESFFGFFLVLEIVMRMSFLKCRKYWCGPDRYWNWFDLVLAGAGIADLTIQFVTASSGVGGTSLLRFCRLIRLVRIVKVFRIKAMKDLRLMVKGLVAGIRTLLLAFTLLFGVLYVISGFATITIGTNREAEERGLARFFENIPVSMFTAFRCFTGECVNDEGQPIHSILAKIFGWRFIFSYVASYMLVTMGIFNVILAVYVDITMKAAKENDAQTAEQYSRESVRVARTTRELLKKFATAYHVYHAEDNGRKAPKRLSQTRMNMGGLYADVGDHEAIAITKDLFLLIIQDRTVQKLMDELELPPDRANLFEIIDADGSGTLQITELLQGLLKIRGEISKSDTIASYLVTKAVQAAVVEHKEDYHEFKKKFKEHSQVLDLKLNLLMRLVTQGEGEPKNVLATAREVTPEMSRQMSPEELMAKIISAEAQAEVTEVTRNGSVTSRALPLPIKPCATTEDEAPPAWTDVGTQSAESDAAFTTTAVVVEDVEDLERDESPG